jgi:prepilin-type N-terminal cleavage/methylation domain-containing protein
MKDRSRLNRGFTFIETSVAMALLVSGLIAAAEVFSYAVKANFTSRQRTAAAALLLEKLEEFGSTPLDNALWTPGGALSPDSPLLDFHDRPGPTDAPYLRVWKIEGTVLRSATVIVYAPRSGLSGAPAELVRAALTRGPDFRHE